VSGVASELEALLQVLTNTIYRFKLLYEAAQRMLTDRVCYDTDPKQAVAPRLKVLDMLASQKMPLHAYHFPWPGYGYVAKQGDGYRYYPVPMEIVRVPPKQT
jgi:hypothetical protein